MNLFNFFTNIFSKKSLLSTRILEKKQQLGKDVIQAASVLVDSLIELQDRETIKTAQIRLELSIDRLTAYCIVKDPARFEKTIRKVR